MVLISGAAEGLDVLLGQARVRIGAQAVGLDQFQLPQEFGKIVGGCVFQFTLEGVEPVRSPLGMGHFHGRDDGEIEGNDDDLVVPQFALLHLRQEGRGDLRAALDLNIDFLAGRNGGEDLPEDGHACACKAGASQLAYIEGLQIRESAFGHDELLARDLLGVAVVKADDVAIPGEMEVAFDGVGLLGPRQLEGGKSVLGRFFGRAAVGDQKRSGRSGTGEHEKGCKEEWESHCELGVAEAESRQPIAENGVITIDDYNSLRNNRRHFTWADFPPCTCKPMKPVGVKCFSSVSLKSARATPWSQV